MIEVIKVKPNIERVFLIYFQISTDLKKSLKNCLNTPKDIVN
ncbi:hypothetical protein IGK47_003674 [Enterococcus sp. AZ007]